MASYPLTAGLCPNINKHIGMTLFAVFRCFRRVRDGILGVLFFLPHDITSCPTFTEG
jgi:hypothetical protein